MVNGLVRRRLVLAGAVALAFGSLGAACAGDDDTTSGSTTAVTPAASVTTSSTAATTATTATPTTGATTTIGATTTTDVTTTTTASTTTDVTTTTGATTATTAAPQRETLVNVYWGWDVVNPPAGGPERIGAGGRQVAADTPVRNSLEAMFDGTNTVEQETGMISSIPPGTEVLGISVDGTTATVDLSEEFSRSGGSLDETMRLAQVVFTVTQFDGFDRVKFQIDGEPRDPVLSHGFVVGHGLTRDDFENVRPTILIEQPYPGTEVSNPLVIRGESNTFEGTVRYAITSGGGDGLIVTEGFTTATAGSGTWGDFEVVVDLADFSADYVPGPGSVIMWEDSARDGTQVGVVEIPIVLPDL